MAETMIPRAETRASVNPTTRPAVEPRAWRRAHLSWGTAALNPRGGGFQRPFFPKNTGIIP